MNNFKVGDIVLTHRFFNDDLSRRGKVLKVNSIGEGFANNGFIYVDFGGGDQNHFWLDPRLVELDNEYPQERLI